jgi:hypothetical protein
MNGCWRLSWAAVVLLLGAGCSSEQDELRKERGELEANRQNWQCVLDRSPGGARREDEVLQGIGRINGRIGEIDRELAK